MNGILVFGLGSLIGLGFFALVTARDGGMTALFGRLTAIRAMRPGILVAPAVGLAAFAVTSWPALGVACTAGLLAIPGVGRRPVTQRDERELVEAVATWTEQIRDTLAGAHGLEEAIIAASQRSPAAIEGAVNRLTAYMAYGRLEDGLRRFAADIDHPTADFVVAALSTANQFQARDITQLLGHVAQCARDESRMRSRVWVSRARTRSAIRIIAAVVVLFTAGLTIFNRGYLEPYSTTDGQIVLGVVLATFAAALVLMHKMSVISMPRRFIGRRETEYV
jgi:Flp pilus assembly protein TadB